MIPSPTFLEEQELWNKGITYIAGIDEVGRGAFAGPVVAAAVVLNPSFPLHPEIHDSKLLTPKKRVMLAEYIKTHAQAFSIASVGVHVINKFGVGKATHAAFRLAVRKLPVRPDFLLIDAFYIPRIRKAIQKPIIKGDQKCISIAAASILAKVYRDEFMSNLPVRYKHYNFSIHKGYGTKMHQEKMKTHGLCDLHRMSFRLEKFVL